MKKGYKIDFQKIRRKTQLKDYSAFQLYLKNIFNELAIRNPEEKDKKVLHKLTFIKYMKIPFILGEKIFNCLDKNQKNYIFQNQFIDGIVNLYIGDLEEVQLMIFNILDFDRDGIIIPEDSRLLITFIKGIGNSIKNVVKLKTKLKKEVNDEENLEEINELVSKFFDGKSKMTFEEYKHNIDQINSDVFFVFIYYLYVNKPFNESSVRILKMLNSTGNSDLTNSFCSSASSGNSSNGDIQEKITITSGSRTLKSFISDLVDIDIDDIENGCRESEKQNDDDKKNDMNASEEEYLMTQLTERKNQIDIPTINLNKEHLSLSDLKSNKDYISHNEKNLKLLSKDKIYNSRRNFDKRNLSNNKNNKKSQNKNINNLNNLNSKNNLNFNEDRNILIDSNIKINSPNIKNNNNFCFKINADDDNINFKNSIKQEDERRLEEIKDNLMIKKSPSNMSFSKNSSDAMVSSNRNTNINSINVNMPNFTINTINDSKSKDKDNIQSSNSINFSEKNLIQISSCDSKNSMQKNKENLQPQLQVSTYGNNLYDDPSEFKINPADILYEGYIYKTRKGNILRKYFLCIIGTDLIYFSNSKKTKLKGMHNLTGIYILEEEKVNKERKENENEKNMDDSNTFFQFQLIFNKKKRSYFCLNQDEVKNWIKYIKQAIGLRDIKDYYDFGNKLGEGKFGLVKGAFDKKTRDKVAIKIIDKSKLEGIEQEMVMTEVEIMTFCRHSNIVKCFDHFEDHENIYIVLEYLSGGTLVKFLSFQDSILNEKKIKEIIHQIAKGINYMHYFGILHRDLKPENLMMSDKNYEIAKLKIVDFGLCKILGVKEEANEAYGTLSFAAPEVVLNKSYNNTVDVWSIGVIKYFLVSGNLPFVSNDKNFDKIVNQITTAEVTFNPQVWSRLSPLSIDLTKKCLEKNPKNRLNITDFINHEWFREKDK